MTVLAHISDLHFGAVDPNAATRLADQINDANVDGVIVTGDLTQAARKREFAEAADYLKRYTAPLIVVPGNHDVPVYNLGQRMVDPWRRYRQYIADDLCPSIAIDDIHIVGLNSARRAGVSFDWSLGRLSSKQLNGAVQSLRRAESAALKLVAFHHPVIKGPGRAGEAVINNPERTLEVFASAGTDAILTGHAHVAQAHLYEDASTPIIVTAAGTASSTRLRGELPSYNLLQWKDGIFSVGIHRYGEDGYRRERTRKFQRIDNKWKMLSKP